jgi:hypothetical protein
MSWTECSSVEIALEASPPQRAAAIPDSFVPPAQALLDELTVRIPGRFRWLADAARLRTGNRFHAEARACAARLGVSWRDIMLANISYDLLLSKLGCSTVALATPSGPVLARNMDWCPENLLARSSLLTRWTRAGKLAFASAGWPAAIGVVSGLSVRGFGLVLNAVSGPERSNPFGYPMLLFLRRVIEEADGYEEALTRLHDTPLTSPGLITLVGTRNEERVVIERSPRRAVLRHPEGLAPLVTTNDYRAFGRVTSGLEMLTETACRRFDVLQRAAADATGGREVADEELLYWLCDEEVAQDITAQHVIIRPALSTLRLFVPRRLLRNRGS